MLWWGPRVMTRLRASHSQAHIPGRAPTLGWPLWSGHSCHLRAAPTVKCPSRGVCFCGGGGGSFGGGGGSSPPPSCPGGADFLEAPKALKEIVLPSAVHLEERLTVSQSVS